MNVVVWVTAVSTLLLDQISKFFVLQSFPLNKPNAIVKDFFYLTPIYNTGAAFGIFKNQTLFFIITSIIAVIAVGIFLGKRSERILARDIGFALILGGALGNLIDRLRFGYVVDFLDFRVWPVFNFADAGITLGTALVILSLCTLYSSR